MTHKLVREVTRALRSTGLSWEIKPGKKHHRVFLEDEQVLVLSMGGKLHSAGVRSATSIIRKRAGEILADRERAVPRAQAKLLSSHSG